LQLGSAKAADAAKERAVVAMTLAMILFMWASLTG
jgi:hypothetical protein